MLMTCLLRRVVLSLERTRADARYSVSVFRLLCFCELCDSWQSTTVVVPQISEGRYVGSDDDDPLRLLVDDARDLRMQVDAIKRMDVP